VCVSALTQIDTGNVTERIIAEKDLRRNILRKRVIFGKEDEDLIALTGVTYQLYRFGIRCIETLFSQLTSRIVVILKLSSKIKNQSGFMPLRIVYFRLRSGNTTTS
jgi:hypothetical protein